MAGAQRGLPDRVGCINGKYFAIEFKKSEAEARRKTGRAVLQTYTLAQIEEAGGHSFIAYPENWEKVLLNIKRISDE